MPIICPWIREEIFFLVGQPSPILNLFLFFLCTVPKISVASRIQTRIVVVGGKDADHYTTTTAEKLLLSGAKLNHIPR